MSVLWLARRMGLNMFTRRTLPDSEAQQEPLQKAESLEYSLLEGKEEWNFKDQSKEGGAGLQRTASEIKAAQRHKCTWRQTSLVQRTLTILVCSLACLLLVALDLVGVHLVSAVIRNANQLGRQCIIAQQSASQTLVPPASRFAIITASDNNNTFHKRPFQGLSEVVSPNKAAYAKRHGYQFIDASDVVDTSRPPSWSKILALKRHLRESDWLFWTDADSLVTNFTIRLDELVNQMLREGNFKEGTLPDMIATEDATGINAGMFFMRNSQWSHDFLDRWWSQTDFVLPRGLCRSGDNDALKHIMRLMPRAEKQQHVHIARMQCSFNSNLWIPTPRNHVRLYTKFQRLWQGTYSSGDFIVHLAGLNDKKKYAIQVLEELGLRPQT